MASFMDGLSVRSLDISNSLHEHWIMAGKVSAPSKKMARKATRLMTTKLMDVKEVFGRIDPNKVAEQIEPCCIPCSGPWLRVAEEHSVRLEVVAIAFEIVYAEEEAPQIIRT